MTQSGVSQAVQQIEEDLQVKLIDRSRRPFVLTAEGQTFHSGCLQLLKQFDSLTEEVRSLGSQGPELNGRVTVAAIYSIGLGYKLPLKRLVELQLPKAQVTYRYGHPDEVYRLVEQRQVDFGLVSYPVSSKSISVREWREERMLLVACSDHPMNKRERTEPSDLDGENLVAFAPNLRIRQEIDRYLRHVGISMQIVAEFDNIDSVKHGLEVNQAVAFLPEPAVAEELRSGELTAIHCPWLKLLRPLGLIQCKAATPGPTARRVMELILGEGREQANSDVANTALLESTAASADVVANY